jgi:hypothetical protein
MAPRLSNLGICYEAIQRIYRNAVICQLRKRLSEAYGEQYEDRVKGPFKKEWEAIKAAAEERRLTGEVEGALVDSLDFLGVNHFFNLFESFYPQIFPVDNGLHPAQLKSNRQTILGWVKSVKNLRDPLSHPAERDYTFEDAFAMLDPARRVLLRLDLQSEATDVKAWMNELQGLSIAIDAVAEPLEDRLPPPETIIVDFVGRETELLALSEWFETPDTRRWALAGEGGKGKSAIAYRFATQIKNLAPDPFQMVIWLSAKKRRFDEGEILDVATPDFGDLSTALDSLLSAYGWDECRTKPLVDRKIQVLQLLEEFPAFLVVDDADSLEGTSEDAAEFFTFDVPRTRTKVLLTSRRVLFGMGNTTTHVSGLEGQDALDFISSRCRLTELGRVHTSEVLQR